MESPFMGNHESSLLISRCDLQPWQVILQASFRCIIMVAISSLWVVTNKHASLVGSRMFVPNFRLLRVRPAAEIQASCFMDDGGRTAFYVLLLCGQIKGTARNRKWVCPVGVLRNLWSDWRLRLRKDNSCHSTFLLRLQKNIIINTLQGLLWCTLPALHINIKTEQKVDVPSWFKKGSLIWVQEGTNGCALVRCEG